MKSKTEKNREVSRIDGCVSMVVLKGSINYACYIIFIILLSLIAVF